VDDPRGWHGAFWRAGDALRCEAVRSRRAVKIIAAVTANLQPARACLFGTAFCRPERPPCACPPLLPARPSTHTPHEHTHTPTHPRTHTRTRSARRRTPYSVRSPIPDQEAKLLGVSHARSPPPPSLRSLDRCHPAPALGKHQLEQSSTH
jgi:hypothetical protein